MSPIPVSAMTMEDIYNGDAIHAEAVIRQLAFEAAIKQNKAVGSPIPVGKRNSSPISSQCDSLQQQQLLWQQISALKVSNQMQMLEGHRKLDRSFSEPVRQQQSPVNQVTTGASRYKTELCRPFAETGKCKYSDKCQFAHGAEELRSMARHPKYKTELCRTFHTSGLCGYGTRCHFIHNEDERRAPSSPDGSPPPMPSPRSIGSLSLLQEDQVPVSFPNSFNGNFESKPFTLYGRSDFAPSSPQFAPSSPPQGSPPTSGDSFYSTPTYKSSEFSSTVNGGGSMSSPCLSDMAHQEELFVPIEYPRQVPVKEEITIPTPKHYGKHDVIGGIRLPIFQNLTTKV